MQENHDWQFSDGPSTTEERGLVRHGSDGFRRVDSADLLGTEREILIQHAGQAYRLRMTASGKLILTK